MKKFFIPLLLSFGILTFLTGCGKDEPAAPVDTEVKAADLTDFYVYMQSNTGSLLQVMTFREENGSVKATLDGSNFSIERQVSLIKDGNLYFFSFDYDGNDQEVYKLGFSKNGAGNINLQSFSYRNNANPARTIQPGLAKVSLLGNVMLDNKTFSVQGNQTVNIKFYTSFKWQRFNGAQAPGLVENYTFLNSNVGFRADNGFFAVFVRSGNLLRATVYDSANSTLQFYYNP